MARERRRRYRRVERRYVVDYVLNKYKSFIRVFYNLRLGPPPEWVARAVPGVPAGTYRPWQRYADAVVVTEATIDLIEAKVHNWKVGVGYLLEYEKLLPQTPELRPYLGRPVRKILVIPLPDPWVIQNAAAYGIIVDIYCPDWLVPILREKHYLP